MILLYKEEEICMNPYFTENMKHMGIIREVDEGDYFYDQNIQQKDTRIYTKKDRLFINETKQVYSILTIEELELILINIIYPVNVLCLRYIL